MNIFHCTTSSSICADEAELPPCWMRESGGHAIMHAGFGGHSAHSFPSFPFCILPGSQSEGNNTNPLTVSLADRVADQVAVWDGMALSIREPIGGLEELGGSGSRMGEWENG